jgi:hypothetical protein
VAGSSPVFSLPSRLFPSKFPARILLWTSCAAWRFSCMFSLSRSRQGVHFLNDMGGHFGILLIYQKLSVSVHIVNTVCGVSVMASLPLVPAS